MILLANVCEELSSRGMGIHTNTHTHTHVLIEYNESLMETICILQKMEQREKLFIWPCHRAHPSGIHIRTPSTHSAQHRVINDSNVFK